MTFIPKNKYSVVNPVIMAMIGWVIFFFLYSVLKNIPWMERYSAYFPLIGEAGLDAVAATLTFKLWRKVKNVAHRKIFLILSVSFVASLMADLIYNVVLNLFNFKYENTIIVTLFDVPFALFLFLQLVVWANLILLNKNIVTNGKKTFYIPNIILSALMFIMFMFGIPWKINYLSAIGLFQSIDTILEVSGFALATICLARAKGQLIRFLTIGYLIVVSSDFIIRYYVVSGSIPYLSPFESTWVLGLLIICVGCYLSLSEKNNEDFRLLPVNSLQSQITIWSLILWLGSALLFIGSNYLFSEHYGYRQITPGFLSILVPFSVLSIIGSSYLSTKISSTLHRLENIINEYIETDSANISGLKKKIEIINSKNTRKEEGEKFEIYEVEKLSQFIMNSINELQSTTRIKAEFLMNMSHDFRTPASGIYHMSRSVYKRISDPELKKLQKLIVDSSEQLMNFLEDVLDYSRLNSNKHEINIKNFNIQDVIDEVVLFVSAKAKEKMLSIDCHHAELPVNYNGDRLMIHRIILNIVSNAIKFTHSGSVTIFTNIEELEQKKWVMIKVKDTGIGIDETHHKLIFEPFSRVESAETAKYPGIGLGLSNVLLMLKKLGGKITIESSINMGSTFSVLLPIN
ncbi:MAG TPA: HAMP domain-containing sensor histidine kinase [Candidatus Babeliales bacterium]|nr:HAMP domain-containing sensor histidine kinase [Candidatus Babeliales bacterium]